MTIEMFADLYRGVGFQVVVENDEIKLEQGGIRFRVQIDDEWRASINAFFKAKQYSFDVLTNIEEC